MAKSLSDTYLYSKSPDYNKDIYRFISKANRIDTKSAEFADVLFDIKRRKLSDNLSKIITSKNVVIGITDGTGLPKPYRVFVAKDIKDGNKPKLFIDATQYIKFANGTYDCTNIDWMVSYIIAGTTSFIYAMAPQKLLLNSSIILDGCDCFARLFSYIIDGIYKTTSVQTLKKRIDYLACLYYQINLLGKDFDSESQFRNIKNYAIKISDIDTKDSKVVDILLKLEDFTNINTFVTAVGRICELKDIKLDIVMAHWMQKIGTGTYFALEYFPSFSMALTNTYVGGYLDNQLTIEKVCGPAMVAFVKTILKIGDSVV